MCPHLHLEITALSIFFYFADVTERMSPRRRGLSILQTGGSEEESGLTVLPLPSVAPTLCGPSLTISISIWLPLGPVPPSVARRFEILGWRWRRHDGGGGATLTGGWSL